MILKRCLAAVIIFGFQTRTHTGESTRDDLKAGGSSTRMPPLCRGCRKPAPLWFIGLTQAAGGIGGRVPKSRPAAFANP